MFTAEQFMALDMLERASVVLEHGCEMAERRDGCYAVKLYLVGDFYVELWYNPAVNKIRSLQVVELEALLPEYLKDIDVSDLFKGCR